MGNSTVQLDQISSTQANKEVTANALFDAASPGSLWGRHASATSGLTWAYYGGNFVDNTGTNHAISNGTLTLTASATNYIYANATTGAVSANTTGFPAGSVPLYSVVTNASTATSYTDYRSYQPSATGGGTGTVTSVGLSAPSQFTVTGSPVTGSGTLTFSWGNQTANYVLAGPTSGGAAAPTFRALVAADLPVFVASGSSHAAGAVPDPGSTAGSTKFLREDATWAVPPGSGGGGGTVTDVAASGGIETTLASNADITSSGGVRANLLPTVVTAAHTFVTGDRGAAIITNASGSVTQTLPAATGSSGNFPNGWFCDLTSIGTGTTTVAVPSGAQLDGVTNGTIALSQFGGVRAFTDGTNWFTRRGTGSSGTVKDAVGYYLANNSNGSAFTISRSTDMGSAGALTALSSGRGFVLTAPQNTANGINAIQALQSVPVGSSWTITAMVSFSAGAYSSYAAAGLTVSDSANKLVRFGWDMNGQQCSSNCTYNKWTNVNTFSAKTVIDGGVTIGAPCWLQLKYDGTNFKFYTSTDGETFNLRFSISATDFIGTPSTCGLFVSASDRQSTSSSYVDSLTVFHYAQG
ncbi:hypothetical protein WJ94_16110 [Burkholderia ubonensis]|uniref:hypothetical protein n=1 Tax=Burkholderia ubonensis TaxID=101571 RepID=UPI00075A34F8|nr:hypothetical protein [Burkholderia ubonensis]KVP76933.1 hypothetical protein WJ94_16110 [Burkholderia ubonensis]KVQ87361.1 hypothetical protein WK09_20200 [Burkholderia ubonensis]KWB89947.1 hypothetical protein WL43_07565 [Burkholderia ubonensis]